MERLPEFLYCRDSWQQKAARVLSISDDHFFGPLPPPIATRRVMGEMYAERYTVIPVTEILYAFNESATALSLIDASWTGSLDFRHGHVYVRARDGVFFVHSRSLAELLERLEPYRFLALSHSLFVHIHKVIDFDWKGRLKRVGVASDGATEWLTVNRRHIPAVRETFDLPRRS